MTARAPFPCRERYLNTEVWPLRIAPQKVLLPRSGRPGRAASRFKKASCGLRIAALVRYLSVLSRGRCVA